MSTSNRFVSELAPESTDSPSFGLTSSPFFASTFHHLHATASNATHLLNGSRLLDHMPRWLSPLTDGFGWLNPGASVIAEATGERAGGMAAVVQATTDAQGAAASAAAGNIGTGTASTGAFRAAWSFQHIRNMTGVLAYMTSKWAVTCFILAIILNRTKIFTSGRRNLHLNFVVRLALRIGPILMFTFHTVSLLQAMRCQTSPDYSQLKYGDPGKSFNLDFSADGGLLYTLSSTLLFWQNDSQSCQAVGMITKQAKFRGSLSLLWPLYQSLCVGQFIEVLSCSVQGRPIMTETGMSVFEQSLAFAEAEAMIGNHLGLSVFGFRISTDTKNNTDKEGSSDSTGWLTRDILFDKLNTPPEVLLMALISCLNNLSSQLLALFNLQSKFRLLNTGLWGLCFMSSFVWGFFGSKQTTGADAIFRFPTVCIVGFIPHLLVLIGIIGCACIYSIALTLSVLSPPVGLPRPRSWRERLEFAHDNLQANAHLSSLRLSMHEDFYTVLLKIGFTTLTIASEAVFLNEGKRIGVHRWTWLEEERLKEIQETREYARDRLDSHGSSTVAGGVAMTELTVNDGSRQWRSGYARERTSKSLKPPPGTSARAEAGGVGAMQRSGRYMGAWEFLSGIFRLLTGWVALLAIRLLRRAGVQRLPKWPQFKHSKDCSKRKTDEQPLERRSSEPQSLGFWILSDDGVLSSPENDDVDVEAETKKRHRLAAESWGPKEERHLDSTLYSWWLHGGWWGQQDNSGEYVDSDTNDDDLTSEISLSDSYTIEAREWETDEDDYNDDGRTTPTQLRPYSMPDSRESSPFPDYSLDPAELAQMLDPRNLEQRREAQMLAQHLQSDRIVTRAQYRQSQTHTRKQILTSSILHRPPDFKSSRTDGRLTPDEEATILEHLILSKRSTAADNNRTSNPDNDASWNNGSPGLGASGPQCVVCQSSPRTVLAWPCRCLSLCEECRVSLAMNNFATCVCCRQDVVGFSRLFVP
ncbi:MAG: hypothetical protein Q9218_003934 [Villophora microphyllina]